MKQEVFFKNIRNEIIKHLKECDSDLKIAVAWFTDKTIIQEVNKLVKNGVSVSLIIYDDKINQKDLFEELYYNEAKIYLSKKLMHNKFCIIDNTTVINGSYNWTNNAHTNDENIQISYNDISLSNKFKVEFEKLALGCNKIDDYFEYSLSNLKRVDCEFKTYYANWPQYEFPYFIDLTSLKINNLKNINFKIQGHTYLLFDKFEEEEFVWYYFLLISQYSIGKILRIKNQKINLPLSFNYVHLNFLDDNNVCEFYNSFYVVEEHVNKYSNSGYDRNYIYSIDKYGKISSEKFRYTSKLTDYHYIMDLQSNELKPYFIDNLLKQYFINYDLFKKINNNFYIIKYLKQYSDRKYGLLNMFNQVILYPQYDDYNYKINDSYIDFIEFPILELDNLKDYVCKARIKYQNYENDSISDLKIFRYSIENFKLLKTFKISSNNKSSEVTYLFISDEKNYNDLYKLVSQFSIDFRVRHPNIKIFITIDEFNELRTKFSNKSKITQLLNNYKAVRENAQSYYDSKEKEEKEGCYIATMVYKDYEHSDVKLLRAFRDRCLKKYFFGKIFIKKYYQYSPKFVHFAKRNIPLYILSKNLIFIIVKIIKKFKSSSKKKDKNE